MTQIKKRIAILGFGNIGSSIAKGLIDSKLVKPGDLMITRRNKNLLEEARKTGFSVSTDNRETVERAEIIILTVTPQQTNELLDEIKESITKDHIIMSIVSGVSIRKIKEHLGKDPAVVRVMPNTAIAIQESMTCICAEEKDGHAIELAQKIFDSVGKTVVISEDLMGPATALCACGTAFFLRAVRAASQGGIEIGFHAAESLFMAAQTAKGAASMLLKEGAHPESEIDKVTTPQGITISGLNQMEHHGFSSSLIRGIVSAAGKAENIYSNDE